MGQKSGITYTRLFSPATLAPPGAVRAPKASEPGRPYENSPGKTAEHSSEI